MADVCTIEMVGVEIDGINLGDFFDGLDWNCLCYATRTHCEA